MASTQLSNSCESKKVETTTCYKQEINVLKVFQTFSKLTMKTSERRVLVFLFWTINIIRIFIITLNKDLPAEKTQHLKIHKHWPVLSYARKHKINVLHVLLNILKVKTEDTSAGVSPSRHLLVQSKQWKRQTEKGVKFVQNWQ